MHTLIRYSDLNPGANLFSFSAFKAKSPCSLQKGFIKKDDGVYWAMLHSTVVSDSTRARPHIKFVLSHGEEVIIDGEVYRVKYLGKYSDCAIFEKVTHAGLEHGGSTGA